jgi:cell division protein FtsZ
MVLFWALIISIILHFIFFMSVNSGDSKHEQSQQTFIEISLITKSAPIKSKKNDGVVTKSHLLATEVQPPHSEASITQIIKEVSVKNIGNTAKIPMFQKKEKPVVEKVVRHVLEDDNNEKVNLDTVTAKSILSPEEQQRRNQERLSKIQDYTSKLKKAEGITEFENEPAYVRRNIQLDNSQKSTQETVSRFGLTEDETGTSLRNNNFLHDNVD